MKKVLSILLCMVLMFSFSACGDSKEDKTTKETAKKESVLQLPYGLEFGMSYDEFCKTITAQGFEAPNLDEASSNNGYLTDLINDSSENTFDWDFMKSESLSKLSKSEDPAEHLTYSFLLPTWSFSFNENKEMYEMYCDFKFPKNELSENNILPEIIASFNETFNFENSIEDLNEGTPIIWENDKLGVSIRLFNSETISQVVVTYHNFEHDLEK